MTADVISLTAAPISMQTMRLSIDVPKSQLKGYEVPSGALTVEIKRKRKRRSLNANGYFWKLAGELAEKLQTTKEAVYRQAIRDVGVYRVVSVDEDLVDDLIADWQGRGLGWIAEKMDSTYYGKPNVLFYRGSSVYSTAEMSRLIDWVIEEAEAQGIDTLTPAEKARLIEEWEPCTKSNGAGS